MKRLFILRHGRAESPAAQGSDFERCLTESGRSDVARVASRLAARGIRPRRLVASPARRAQETAQIVAQVLGHPGQAVIYDPELYLASRQVLLDHLASQPGEVDTLLLVGHEPGLSDLGRYLTNVGLDALPTSAVFAVEWDGRDWRDPGFGGAEFAFFESLLSSSSEPP